MGVKKVYQPLLGTAAVFMDWDATGPIPAGAHRVRALYVDADGKLVVVYDTTPHEGDPMPFTTLIVEGAGGGQVATTPIPFNKKLAVAGTSEMLFTVPAGQLLVVLDVVCYGGQQEAHLSLVPDAAATGSSATIPNGGQYSKDDISLLEGDYEFIGEPGKRPSLRGVAWTMAAPV